MMNCPDCGYEMDFMEPIDSWGNGWEGYHRYWSEAEYPDEGSVYCNCKPCPECGGKGKSPRNPPKFETMGVTNISPVWISFPPRICPTCNGTGIEGGKYG